MVVKDTYDYNQKAQVRDELRDFIRKYYINPSARKNLKVLTFLGHEDHELRQIWDPLGIPRNNLTVLERDNQVYDFLKEKDLGVNLVKGTIEDFVLDTDETFDIINLDYQSYFNVVTKETLKTIAYNGMLNKKGVLATWVSGKRENFTASSLYRANLSSRLDRGIFDVSKEEALADRSNVVSSEITTAFIDGRTNYEAHPLINTLGLMDEYLDYLKNSDRFKYLSKLFLDAMLNKSEDNDKLLTFAQKFRPNQLEAFKNMRYSALRKQPISKEDILNFSEHMHRLEGMDFVNKQIQILLAESSRRGVSAAQYSNIKSIGENIANSSEEMKQTIKDFATILRGALYYQNIDGYLSLDTKRFKYISDNNTPMYVDFNLFNQTDLSNIASIKVLNKTFKKKIYVDGWDKLFNRIDRMNEFISFKNKCNDPEEFCGERIEIAARPKIMIPELNYTVSDNAERKLPSNEPKKYHTNILVNQDMDSLVSISSSDSNHTSFNLDWSPEISLLIAQGKSAREINILYPEYPVMKLAGMKAAYKRKENARALGIDSNQDINTVSESNKSIESNQDLSKEEAIFLIKSGFTIEDIANTYSAYDKNQLKAFKAHNTMGRY